MLPILVIEPIQGNDEVLRQFFEADLLDALRLLFALLTLELQLLILLVLFQQLFYLLLMLLQQVQTQLVEFLNGPIDILLAFAASEH